ncbi:hypothetical protein M9458_012179, partial [Cirrhinus mrigala]
DTGPSRPFDWPTPDQALPSVTKSSLAESTNSTRPRAISFLLFLNSIRNGAAGTQPAHSPSWWTV